MPDEPKLPMHPVWDFQPRPRATVFDFFPELFNGPGALYLSSKWARRGVDNFPLNAAQPPA